MNKNQAQISSKKVSSEFYSLTPSTLISLFEIDVTNLAFDTGLIFDINDNKDTIFRFHNNVKLGNNDIFWNGKRYIAAPIDVQGFETNGSGTLPVPTMSLSTNDDGIAAFTVLKEKIRQLGDLVGAKFTRIRTLAKYLDLVNFIDSITPELGFEPDPYATLGVDIFFIDRKANENRNYIQFELASILDVEGIKLPLRIVTSTRCVFSYRGSGCLYEYISRRDIQEHGANSILLSSAPPVSNDRDELFSDLLPNTVLIDRGPYEANKTYFIGHTVFLEKDNIKYYFVAKINAPSNPPPDQNSWLADSCSKGIKGCRSRFGVVNQGSLPLGFFPACGKYS